jgi:hypothetical protein
MIPVPGTAKHDPNNPPWVIVALTTLPEQSAAET